MKRYAIIVAVAITTLGVGPGVALASAPAAGGLVGSCNMIMDPSMGHTMQDVIQNASLSSFHGNDGMRHSVEISCVER